MNPGAYSGQKFLALAEIHEQPPDRAEEEKA